ncbi:MarR family winged helix-turn-helix transcriptional regulator [Streptomyces sp. NPDC057382]|uniref:MarR family winged helix-turn-helix transcriptional regulator n=1 Tax=unclassified Streptomyces TaxID=2593676 RepID=UPI00363664E7
MRHPDREHVSVELFGQLVRAVHAISQAGARELRSEGLTPAQYKTLAMVAARPDMQQRDLSDALGVTKGNISMLVARLESDGLLSRTPAGAAYLLRLTPDGRDLVNRLRPQHARFMAACFAPLSDDELDTLGGLLSRLEADRP